VAAVAGPGTRQCLLGTQDVDVSTDQNDGVQDAVGAEALILAKTPDTARLELIRPASG
jgi:hypothetical protein